MSASMGRSWVEPFLGESGGSVPVCWSAVACVGVAGGLVLPSTSAGGSSCGTDGGVLGAA